MCGFDERRRFRIVAERVSQLTNSDFENAFADISLGPNAAQEIFFGDELSGAADELTEHREGFGPEFDNLNAPQQTFIGPVQAVVIADYAVFVAQRIT